MLPTFGATVVTNTVITGSSTWDALAIPNCKAWSLKARGANALRFSHQASGAAYATIPSGGSYDSPACDFQAQTLYINGTAADVAELVTFN